MTNKQKAYGALFITSTVWGSTWVAMKFGVSKMPALQLAFIRQLMGGLIFLFFYIGIKKFALPTKQQLWQFFILSVFTFVFANGFSTWSLQFIPSGLGALIGALYPLCVVIIEYFFFNNKQISLLSVVGIILGITGIAVVFYENAFAVKEQQYFLGIGLALFATIAWSYSTIMIARQKVKINPYYALGWQLFFGAVSMFVISYASGNHIAITAIPLQSWLAIFYLVVAGSVFTFVAFIYSMKHLPTPIASLYAYINPIVAISIGTFLLDEHISVRLVVGTVITLIGVYLVNYSLKKATAKQLAATDADKL